MVDVTTLVLILFFIVILFILVVNYEEIIMTFKEIFFKK